MFQVTPVKREVMDLWPVAESGLPIRVVHSMGSSGVTRIGQLRSWTDQDLLSLRSLGRISLGHIRHFFRLCHHIEQGRQYFQSIQEVMSILLDGPEMKVLAGRYGLSGRELDLSKNVLTLQEIGNAEHLTRERVRQVQATAVAKLQTRLASVCLQPFFDHFARCLGECGGVAACSDLAPAQNDPALGGYGICGVLLLLCDVAPDRFHVLHGFFSTLPARSLQAVESQAVAFLQKQARAVTLDEVLKALPALPGVERADQRRRVAACVLDHIPGVAATTDQRCFLYASGTASFLVEVLRDMNRPAHYRAVTNAFNERVKPSSRRGAGFILDQLNAHPHCMRVDRGVYDLKAG